MMVRFYCNIRANIHSTMESEWFDPVKDVGLDEGEWEQMSDEDKWKEAERWANEILEIGYEESSY